MFPIGDDNSDIRIVPYVTYAIIALNVIVFVILQGIGSNEAFTYAFFFSSERNHDRNRPDRCGSDYGFGRQSSGTTSASTDTADRLL